MTRTWRKLEPKEFPGPIAISIHSTPLLGASKRDSPRLVVPVIPAWLRPVEGLSTEDEGGTSGVEHPTDGGYIAKVYRPSSSALAKNPAASGEIRMWYP